jgi:SET domain-containing protein
MNHSKNANVIDRPGNSHISIAARDISPGEEITCDYHLFDLLAKRHLHRNKKKR